MPFHHDSPERLAKQIIHNQEKLMADLTALTSAVSENTSAVEAAVNKLQASSTEQPAVDALTTQINEAVAKLTAAVAA